MIVFNYVSLYMLAFLARTVFALKDYCYYDVQETLQYGVSGLWSDTCCSSTGDTINYFETIGLFAQLNASQTTTLYDSTCGLPLFTAPIGRTFEEWRVECEEYGQLLFREEEVNWNNTVLESGELVSICGTRVGEYTSSSSSVDVYSVYIACISGMPIDGVTTSTVLNNLNGSASNPGSLIDPGNATSLIGIVLLASFGAVLALLSVASCYQWWEKKQADLWCNEGGPLKLLFLEDEKLSQECLETEYTVSIPPAPVYYEKNRGSGGLLAADEDGEKQWDGMNRVDVDEAVDNQERVKDECVCSE